MADKEDDGIFYVEKIIDIKWENVNGAETPRYRVRWIDFSPLSDTWEPAENFSPTLKAFTDFNKAFEQMKAERMNYLQEMGQEITEAELRKVNILSKEIEEIRMRRGKSTNIAYLVKWVDVDKPTWLPESDLVHAQDKVNEFLHAGRVKQVQRKSKFQVYDVNLDSERRKQEQEFYKKIEKGDVSLLQTDLYSRVKGRLKRNNPLRPSTSSAGDWQGPQGSSELSRQNISSPTATGSANRKMMQEQNSSKCMLSDEQTRKISELLTLCFKTSGINLRQGSNILSTEEDAMELQHQASSSESRIPRRSFLAGLPQFNPDRSKNEFKRLAQQELELSKEEFEAAADQDDYETLLAAMQSVNIPDVDFDHLFLKAARRGGRDVALLLAVCVTNLSACDEYGNSAICMAAERGDICFAYHLFRMKVPMTSWNGANETLLQIALKSGHKHFIKFLHEFENECSDLID